MTSTFLMPLAIGATYAIGGNIMTDAFGVIAMVAMLPPITVQILGLVYRIKLSLDKEENSLVTADTEEFEVIDMEPVLTETVSEAPRDKDETLELPIYTEPQTAEDYPDIIEFTLPF